MATSRHWSVHQLDVKNAFLHGDLSETVYIHQPSGLQDFAHPDYVCLLQRSLYGLQQAYRAWFQRFTAYITRVGFHHSRCDISLFIYKHGTHIAYLLLYVDDIVLTASSEILLQQIVASLHQELSMTDLGSLNYFIGIFVTHDSSGMFLSQHKYAAEILERAHMANCNPSRAPVDIESKLGDDVQQVCLYMHDTREPYFSALKQILSAVYLSSNPVQHQRTKHIEIDIHFIHDLVAAGQVRVLHVPSRYQYAYIFTKGLPYALFEEFYTRDYDLWSMRMEQYLTHTDYALWEVIVNSDSVLPVASASVGTEDPIPPKTAEQKLAWKNELKAKSTPLLAIPDEHLLKFNVVKDENTLWEAI
ncbi:ribonuclease H-like domain-containing protein [Tanacetum coccineum]